MLKLSQTLFALALVGTVGSSALALSERDMDLKVSPQERADIEKVLTGGDVKLSTETLLAISRDTLAERGSKTGAGINDGIDKSSLFAIEGVNASLKDVVRAISLDPKKIEFVMKVSEKIKTVDKDHQFWAAEFLKMVSVMSVTQLAEVNNPKMISHFGELVSTYDGTALKNHARMMNIAAGVFATNSTMGFHQGFDKAAKIDLMKRENYSETDADAKVKELDTNDEDGCFI
jgi:hypothetical protein